MTTATQVKSYLLVAIDGFRRDRPDSKFLEGYLAALQDVHSENFITKKVRSSANAFRK